MNTALDPAKSQERKEAVEKAKTQYNNEFGSMDLVKSYKSLFELLWYSQLPCFDVRNITSTHKDEMSLIKKCYWKEKQIDCTSIFFTRPTDRGMCCTFNVEAAEKMFEDKKYKVSSLNILSICYGKKDFIRRLHINFFTSTNS